MAPLLQPRKGWENEKLASYLLSRFSFVAQPTSIADDLGSDFFCTIFEIQNNSGTDTLRPRSSFAIQIKSSTSKVSMDNKIDYLSRLQMPFFMGVVNQSPPKMQIYSAELLPFMFAHKGTPECLSMEPIPSTELDLENYLDTDGPGSFSLRCPEVAELRVDDDRPMLTAKVAKLLEICTRCQSNIATRLSEEHIYDFDGKGYPYVLAGAGSSQYFRSNLLKRVVEVFANLHWLLENGTPAREIVREFRAYERLCNDLREIGVGDLPGLIPYYGLVKAKLQGLGGG